MSSPQRPDQFPPKTPGQTRGKLGSSKMTILVVVGATLVGLVALGVFVDQDADPTAAPSPVPSPISPTPSPVPSFSPAPEPDLSKVPDVDGMRFQSARQRLRAQRLGVALSKVLSRREAGTVIRQEYKAGERLEEGTVVELVIAKPYPRVPGVMGDRLAGARRDLTREGFSVRVKKQMSSAPSGTVLQQNPSAGSQVRPGRRVTLIVAKPPPQPASNGGGGGGDGGSSGGGADDSLPPASDYDCAGGTGDGPEYVNGPVQIVGADQYGLDADGDGVGCE